MSRFRKFAQQSRVAIRANSDLSSFGERKSIEIPSVRLLSSSSQSDYSSLSREKDFLNFDSS